MNAIDAIGGTLDEAVEVGLQYSINEAKKGGSVPLSQVFIFGDKPANPVETVVKRRTEYKVNWEGTRF